ncbi:unnamed protein product [Cuscuta europaea]|uniref:NTF2 domain-containing protein n=1 Tax=Cuscuta europaea TaxID=41803 RepID=A0A9P0Z279_CUSEU|nr:unnamed protein product [Cuscuta europaea]
MSCTTTLKAINDKILSLHCDGLRVEVKSIDAQDSFYGGVSVLVTGYLIGKNNQARSFSQTFFLAPQQRWYFVLNDMLRYVEPNGIPADQNRDVPLVINQVPDDMLPCVETVHQRDTPAEEEPNAEVDTGEEALGGWGPMLKKIKNN